VHVTDSLGIKLTKGRRCIGSRCVTLARARDGLFGNQLTKGRRCIGSRCVTLARARDGLFGNQLTKGRRCIGSRCVTLARAVQVSRISFVDCKAHPGNRFASYAHVRYPPLVPRFSIARHKHGNHFASCAHVRLSGWGQIPLQRVKEGIDYALRCFQGF
jgi:hypothetical protein